MIGHPILDMQHVTFLNLLHQAQRHASEGNQFTGLLTLLGRLQDYIHNHFDDEEAFMKMIGYYDLEDHKRNHKIFIDMIQVFEHELVLNGEVDVKILNFAEEWIVNHINKEVIEFREILSKRREEENVQTKIRSETDRRQGCDRRSGDKESLSDAT